MGLLAAALAGLAVICWPADRTARALRSVARVGSRSTQPVGLEVLGGLSVLTRLSARWTRRGDLGADQLLPILDGLSASLRAGLPPADAVALALVGGPEAIRARLAGVLEAARDGRPCAPSWLRAARTAHSTELELLARSWAISEQLGAPLADAVDSAARALRSGRDLSSRLATATAGARTTANILTLLPVAGVGVALLMGIGPAELYGSLPALLSLGAGLVLIAGGRLVVARMISRVTVQS